MSGHIFQESVTDKMYFKALILLAPFTISAALAAPNVVPNPGDQFRCFSRSGAFDPTAANADCAKALMNFPKNVISGAFSRKATSPSLKLPQQEVSGSCAVTVDTITSDAMDTTSWAGLTSSGTQLVLGCAGFAGLSIRTGGVLYTGNHGQLKISVGTAAADGLASNGTTSTVDTS